MMQAKKIVFILCVGMLWATPAIADTVFSFEGLGNAVRRLDTRSRAMGGAGRALIDGRNFSTNNPALLAGFRRPSVSAQFITQRRFLSGSARINDGDVGGFHIVIPLKPGTVFGVALEPLTDMDFGAVDTIGVGDLGYELALDASGGIQAVSLGVAHHFGQRFYAGVRVDWVAMGTFNEKWSKTFFGQNVFFSNDEITRTHRGWVPAVGFVYTPTQKWSLGGNVQVGQNIRQRTTLTTRFVSVNADTEIETLRDVKLPTLVGGGLSYLAGYRWLAALDVERGLWRKTEAGRFNTWDISVGGMVRTGNPDVLTRSRRWEINAGLYYRSLYFPTTGAKQVSEVGASFGVAIPLKKQSGRFRYVLEVGSRGNEADHGVSEKYIKQSFAVTGIFQ
ncbi:MAG: hypothetical protein HOH77_09130 [Candidatus Latescibacteria bacterium]|nr:hypothetical protein [Candidatus Latescibacterota bacterium]